MGTTYPDLLLPLDGDEGPRAEEVKSNHRWAHWVLSNLSQEPEPWGASRVTQGGHHIDPIGQGGAGGPIEGDGAGGWGQAAAPGLLHAGPGSMEEATDVAKGAWRRSALEGTGAPARAGLGAVGGRDGLGDLGGGRSIKREPMDGSEVGRGQEGEEGGGFPLERWRTSRKVEFSHWEGAEKQERRRFPIGKVENIKEY